MTGWVFLIVIPVLAVVLYLWLVWWMSQLMQRARREQTRALRDDEIE